MSIRFRWLKHFEQSKELNIETPELIQLNWDIKISQDWFQLYSKFISIDWPPMKRVNTLELKIAELLISQNYGLGPRYELFQNIDRDVAKAKELVSQVAPLISESRTQLLG